MKEEPHKPSALDKLIAAVQGAEVRDPVPMPDGTLPAVGTPDDPNMRVMHLTELEKSPGEMRLWYRRIERRDYGTDEKDKLGRWEVKKIAGPGYAMMSALGMKERENLVIKFALDEGVGQYPRVLFAFEWFDARLNQTIRQEIKDGFVRG